MSWKIIILPALVILFLGLAYLYMNRYDYIHLGKYYNYSVEMRVNKITNYKCLFIDFYDSDNWIDIMKDFEVDMNKVGPCDDDYF